MMCCLIYFCYIVILLKAEVMGFPVFGQYLLPEEVAAFESRGFLGNKTAWIFEESGIVIPKAAREAARKTCALPGIVGITTDGLPITNALPQNTGNTHQSRGCDTSQFHATQMFRCLLTMETNEFVGIALDGYPIYGPIDESGNTLTKRDLDVCLGRVHNGRYGYHVVQQYPYLIGCFRGEVSLQQSTSDSECYIKETSTDSVLDKSTNHAYDPTSDVINNYDVTVRQPLTETMSSKHMSHLHLPRETTVLKGEQLGQVTTVTNLGSVTGDTSTKIIYNFMERTFTKTGQTKNAPEFEENISVSDAVALPSETMSFVKDESVTTDKYAEMYGEKIQSNSQFVTTEDMSTKPKDLHKDLSTNVLSQINTDYSTEFNIIEKDFSTEFNNLHSNNPTVFQNINSDSSTILNNIETDSSTALNNIEQSTLLNSKNHVDSMKSIKTTGITEGLTNPTNTKEDITDTLTKSSQMIFESSSLSSFPGGQTTSSQLITNSNDYVIIEYYTVDDIINAGVFNLTGNGTVNVTDDLAAILSSLGTEGPMKFTTPAINGGLILDEQSTTEIHDRTGTYIDQEANMQSESATVSPEDDMNSDVSITQQVTSQKPLSIVIHEQSNPGTVIEKLLTSTGPEQSETLISKSSTNEFQQILTDTSPMFLESSEHYRTARNDEQIYVHSSVNSGKATITSSTMFYDEIAEQTTSGYQKTPSIPSSPSSSIKDVSFASTIDTLHTTSVTTSSVLIDEIAEQATDESIDEEPVSHTTSSISALSTLSGDSSTNGEFKVAFENLVETEEHVDASSAPATSPLLTSDMTRANHKVTTDLFYQKLVEFCLNNVKRTTTAFSTTGSTTTTPPTSTNKLVIRLRGKIQDKNEIMKYKPFEKYDWPKPVWVRSSGSVQRLECHLLVAFLSMYTVSSYVLVLM